MRLTSRLHRGRAAWLLAWLAALLNAAAPALAYAAGQPLHELAYGVPGGGPRAVLAQVAHHHAASMPGHMHRHGEGVPHGAPATPHCPYCLDFAAGAPLAPAPLIVATPARIDAAVAAHVATVPLARASLRIASPRAPPQLLSA